MADGPLVERIDASNGTAIVAEQIGVVNVGDHTYDVAGLPNPYLGLASFTYEMRGRYAGRAKQVAEAMSKLTTPGEERVALFVTGASGSGKSSFAHAGLVPALERHYGRLRKEPRWADFRPSRFPLAGLARALVALGLPDALSADPLSTLGTPEDFNRFVQERTPHGQVNLVVIDQFEELFTQSDPVQREVLFAILAGAGPFPELRTHLIATVRADYLPELFDDRGLFTLLKDRSVDLRAMTKEELKEAIERPLQEQNERLGADKR